VINVISFTNAAEGVVFGGFAEEAIEIQVFRVAFAIRFRAQYE
jgi:hypothetical protein